MGKSKNRRVKIMTAPVEKGDLTDDEVTMDALKALEHNHGWKLVMETVNGNVKYLEQIILNRATPGSLVELADEEIEEARTRREILLDFMNTPKMMIEELKGKTYEEKRYDPYYNVNNIEEDKSIDNKVLRK